MEIVSWTHSLRMKLFLTKLIFQLWREYGTKGRARTFCQCYEMLAHQGYCPNSKTKNDTLPLNGALQLREILGISGLTGPRESHFIIRSKQSKESTDEQNQNSDSDLLSFLFRILFTRFCFSLLKF